MRNVYLLHGKGGSPKGSVSQLEPLLQAANPDLRFERPLMPHNDPAVPAERSVEHLAALDLPENSAVIGISLGGLVAARLQELSRPDLRVACVSSPTWADGVHLERRMPNRIAIYSLNDDVIAGRVSEWPELAEALEFPWLSHDTDLHKVRICEHLNAWLARFPR